MGDFNPDGPPKTPEEIAREAVAEYFSRRKETTSEAGQGWDFDQARCDAYIAAAEAGNFFEEVSFSGTYDGDPREATEKSIHDFFDGIASVAGQKAEQLGLVEDASDELEESEAMLDLLEPLKPVEDEEGGE